jgi:HSP20 family molecular chaperone IbpA
MKPAASTESSKTRHRRLERTCSVPQRECLPLRDLTDCLLQAYDHVAHRAYEIFLDRGGRPGGELEDWLCAERELLSELELDCEESGEFVRAMGSVPGFTGEEISIGIEPHWLVILARRESGGDDRRVDTVDGHADGTPRSQEPKRSPKRKSVRMEETGGAGAEPIEPVRGATRTCGDGKLSKPENATTFLDGDSRPDTGPGPDQMPSQMFCVVELPAEVVPSRSIAVLANGLLGIRMPKKLTIDE